MKTISFKGEKRDTSTKASNIRKAGRIPAVLYGGELVEHFSVTKNDIKALIYTPDFRIGEVELDGSKHKCIVKDVQYHPLTENIEHMDFLTIEDGRKLNVDIPVRFKGMSPGVKNGGSLIQSLRRVTVKLDPANLVDEYFIDISELELGDSVKVKDIEDAENIEFMVSTNIPVASVEVPRALKSAEAEAEEALLAEGAEGEAVEGGEAPATEGGDAPAE